MVGPFRERRRGSRVGAAVALVLLASSLMATVLGPAEGERPPFALWVLSLLLGG